MEADTRREPCKSGGTSPGVRRNRGRFGRRSNVTRHTQYAVARLKSLADTQVKRVGKLIAQPKVIPPSEQLRRFLAGEEVWRVEAGQVTPAEFADYEQVMLKRLGTEVK
jgi:hypothetical protein